MQAEADRRGVRRLPALAPLDLRAGGLHVRRALAAAAAARAAAAGPEPAGGRRRSSSAGDFELLLSGDAESPTLRTLPLPDVDALKVPHHGSADPGLPAVLERLRPELAGIEVGRGNTYGHPAPATLAALRGAGVRTYRTDRDGTVSVTVRDGAARETEVDTLAAAASRAASPGRAAAAARRLARVAELKPIYLVCGDDDAKIDAWRARVRRRAEDERGPGGLETFDARASEPDEVAAGLATLSFDPGTRYLLVDDVGAWKAAQLAPLEAALADLPPETVLV